MAMHGLLRRYTICHGISKSIGDDIGEGVGDGIGDNIVKGISDGVGDDVGNGVSNDTAKALVVVRMTSATVSAMVLDYLSRLP